MDSSSLVVNDDLLISDENSDLSDEECMDIATQMKESFKAFKQSLDNCANTSQARLGKISTSTDSVISITDKVINDMEKHLPALIETFAYVVKAAEKDAEYESPETPGGSGLQQVREEYLAQKAKYELDLAKELEKKQNLLADHQKQMKEVGKQINQAEIAVQQYKNIVSQCSKTLALEVIVGGKDKANFWKLRFLDLAESPSTLANLVIDVARFTIVNSSPALPEISLLELTSDTFVRTISSARECFKRFYRG